MSLLEAYNLRNSHGVIADNQDGAKVLLEDGYHGSIKVTPQLGVDESRFRPQPQPELAQKVAQLGYERAMSHYTNQALARQLLTFYKQLLE